jgi:hypothetical protein
VQAQIAAARFYVGLALFWVLFGLCLLLLPTVVGVSGDIIKNALRIGGVLISSVGAFPSAKYLQRKDREFGLRTLSLEYKGLEAAGLLDSPRRKVLDTKYQRFIERMLK